MKRPITAPVLGLIGALAFVAVAQAADQPAQGATAREATAQDEAKKKSDVRDRDCVRSTGSRITSRAGSSKRDCLAVNGRAYTREDLERTGEVDIAEALRKLDPSIH